MQGMFLISHKEKIGSFGIELEWTNKLEFKMKSIYTIKKEGD